MNVKRNAEMQRNVQCREILDCIFFPCNIQRIMMMMIQESNMNHIAKESELKELLCLKYENKSAP